jgi:DNA/RNA endonuclease YhcR with UshA esterase domain
MFKYKSQAMKVLLAMTLAIPLPAALTTGVAKAEGPTDPAPQIAAKVVNENAGKKVLFDNTHGQTAGAADWVIDGGFSDFANGLANAGFAVKELRKATTITYDDLKDYDAFVIGEANVPYKTTEQAAMLQYVQNGGSIFFIADHYNADRNKNRWDGSEVMNGYRRGAWADPAKGMNTEERNSAAMQGVASSDWLGSNFGIRFRYNALGDITANNIVPSDQAFGITNGVSTVAMHAGSTLAIMDPNKAKGIVYLPQTNAAWPNAVDQGVYNGGGVAEGPFVAVSKVGLGKAAFIGDSSPVEDATPKYVREEGGKSKTTYDGFKEQNDATLLVNTVNWLAKKESYTSLDQVRGLQLDKPTAQLPTEDPASSTEPQAEPWAAPAAGYKWYDPTTFAPGSYGYAGTVVQPPTGTPAYSTVHQAQLPNASEFQVRFVADNLAPFATVSGFNLGIYLTGGTQVGQVKNDDGTWPTAYGYSPSFSVTADKNGHASKDVTVRVKPGSNGAANLRVRQGSTNLKTEAVTLANVPAEPLPKDTPPVPATTAISDARTKAAGTTVTVEGVVTTQPGAFGGQGFYLQDASGGVYVFQNAAGYNVGDKIKISGDIDVYNGEVELTSPVAITKTGTADVPAPQTVTAVTDANQGQLLALKGVKIQGLAAATPTGSFEFNAVAADGTITRVRVDARTGLTQSQFPYKEGNTVDVAGVASVFKGTFQLKPRGLSDFAGDTVAPTTDIALSAEPNTNGWFTGDVTVTLTGHDLSPLTTEYALNDGAFAAYTGPFTVSAEGTTVVNYRSTDANGNVEDVKSYTIQLDKTAPVSDVQLSDVANANGWYNKDVNLTFTATDAASGVNAIEVKVNDGEWIATSGNLTVSTEGTTTVQYRAVDKAGNTEAAKSLTVQLDKTAPTVALTQDGQAVHNVNIDGTLSFGLAVNDALSDILSQDLILDGNRIEAGAKLSALNLGLGEHTVKATATDKAGNETTVTYTFVIETSFASMQNMISQFAAAGEIKNQGIANSLSAKLDNAQKQFEKGHADQATKHLQQLQDTLNTFAKNGNITKHVQDVLNQNIQYLLTNGLK